MKTFIALLFATIFLFGCEKEKEEDSLPVIEDPQLVLMAIQSRTTNTSDFEIVKGLTYYSIFKGDTIKGYTNLYTHSREFFMLPGDTFKVWGQSDHPNSHITILTRLVEEDDFAVEYVQQNEEYIFVMP